MKIGSLGDVVFEVSSKKIQTVRDGKWSGSASIQNHQRHLNNSMAEFVGNDADQFSFNIRISEHLGSDVQSEISKLFSHMRRGTALSLTIGTKGYGKYKWLIKKISVTLEHYDKAGNLTCADVAVSLTEYTKE